MPKINRTIFDTSCYHGESIRQSLIELEKKLNADIVIAYGFIDDIFKDRLLYILKKSKKRQNLIIALHGAGGWTYPYDDFIGKIRELG